MTHRWLISEKSEFFFLKNFNIFFSSYLWWKLFIRCQYSCKRTTHLGNTQFSWNSGLKPPSIFSAEPPKFLFSPIIRPNVTNQTRIPAYWDLLCMNCFDQLYEKTFRLKFFRPRKGPICDSFRLWLIFRNKVYQLNFEKARDQSKLYLLPPAFVMVHMIWWDVPPSFPF